LEELNEILNKFKNENIELIIKYSDSLIMKIRKKVKKYNMKSITNNIVEKIRFTSPKQVPQNLIFNIFPTKNTQPKLNNCWNLLEYIK